MDENNTINIQIPEEMNSTKQIKPSKNTQFEKCIELGIEKYTQKCLIEKCKELKISKYSNKKLEQLEDMILEKISKDTEEGNDIENNNTQYVSTIKPEKIKLKPIIKWSGGKGDEIKMFEKYFPEQFTTYIEPFVGGGAVFFNLNPQKAVISDVHTELIDLYKSISEGKMEYIYNFMENNPNDQETYYKIRDKMIITDKLDNAKRFYYQRKTCFRGMLRYNKNGNFNIPFGRYKTINYSDLKNKNYEYLLSKTEILNEGFEYVFDRYNDENNFMFLDPPYDSEFTDYGYCQFGKEEQNKLAELFKNTKIKCLMIIGKTNFIEKLYKDYIVDEYDKKYRFKLHSGRVGDEINTKHLIIKNY
jgi:DNA adenine methylase